MSLILFPHSKFNHRRKTEAGVEDAVYRYLPLVEAAVAAGHLYPLVLVQVAVC